jgi:hypothetical protein
MKTSSLVAVVLIGLGTALIAQSDMHKSANPAPSEAQTSFTQMKSLAGTWQGQVKVDPPQPEWDTGKPARITMRVTSRGNALVHEMGELGPVEDATKVDHPVTMFYLDNGKLLLTHYCDAGNRPRMAARTSPDRKTLEFDFVDVSGNLQYGHMQHAAFTILDPNHHIEEWTYMMPGNKPVHARMDLQRVQ